MAFALRAGVALAAVLAAFALGAAGAEAPVVLKKSPPVSKDADSFPRVAGTSPQAKKINAALDRGDARLRKARGECRDNGMSGRWSWYRMIKAPMRGPGFLSLFAADDYDCGGAHPNTSQLALTYDLATGAPIDWTKYLPASLSAPNDRNTAADGTVIGVVTSPTLLAWYRKQALATMDASLKGDCAEVMETDGSGLILWIDAKAGGVAMQIDDLPHVIAACNTQVVMTTAELRRVGASPKLIGAIEAAHRAKAWTDDF